jgi:hypothetical protein
MTEHAVAYGTAAGSYVPGLLALRIGPLLCEAVGRLARSRDVLLIDATGRDHPRRAGPALHLGAVLGRPTVGVTSRALVADGAWPEDARGAIAPLLLDAETVGFWLRSRAGARPIAVHCGWRTDLDTALPSSWHAQARCESLIRCGRHAESRTEPGRATDELARSDVNGRGCRALGHRRSRRRSRECRSPRKSAALQARDPHSRIRWSPRAQGRIQGLDRIAGSSSCRTADHSRLAPGIETSSMSPSAPSRFTPATRPVYREHRSLGDLVVGPGWASTWTLHQQWLRFAVARRVPLGTWSRHGLALRRPAFEDGSPIPREYSRDRVDVSPSLSWGSGEAVELVLLVDDPDAPVPGSFVHWVMFRLDPSRRGSTEWVTVASRPSVGAQPDQVLRALGPAQ